MEKKDKSLIFFAAIVAVGTLISGFLSSWNFFLREKTSILENEISQTTAGFIFSTKKLGADNRKLNALLDETRKELATTTEQLLLAIAQRDEIGAMYNFEKSRMDEFNSQISNMKGAVTTLEKLKATDEELLKKYSKIYFLNENYTPETFTKINSDYTYNPKQDYLFYSKVWPNLSALMSAAKAGNIDIKIISAYRSFNEQSSLKSSYKVVYGTGANKFSADQGYSEHQLGTTVDFTASTVGASYENFDKTPAYQWLLDNAYSYGFILSYPHNNAYYQYEPWHWRFVGKALAQKLHSENKNFYDLDQREIDKYLISFFD